MYNIIVMDSVIIILLPYMYDVYFIQILMSVVKEQMAALKHVQIRFACGIVDVHVHVAMAFGWVCM